MNVIDRLPVKVSISRLQQFAMLSTKTCSPSSSIELCPKCRRFKFEACHLLIVFLSATQPFLPIVPRSKYSPSSCDRLINDVAIANPSSLTLFPTKSKRRRELCWHCSNAIAILCAHSRPISEPQNLRLVRLLFLLRISPKIPKPWFPRLVLIRSSWIDWLWVIPRMNASIRSLSPGK